jgi:hypothetical protein
VIIDKVDYEHLKHFGMKWGVEDFLEHYGVKGQRWGVRRAQASKSGPGRRATKSDDVSEKESKRKGYNSLTKTHSSKSKRRKAIAKEAAIFGASFAAMTAGMILVDRVLKGLDSNASASIGRRLGPGRQVIKVQNLNPTGKPIRTGLPETKRILALNSGTKMSAVNSFMDQVKTSQSREMVRPIKPDLLTQVSRLRRR